MNARKDDVMHKTQRLEVDPLWNVQEAAKFLGWSVPTLYTKVNRREIAFVKVGGRSLRFRRSDLEKLLTVHPALDAEVGC